MISALEALARAQAFTVANSAQILYAESRIKEASGQGKRQCQVRILSDEEAKYLRNNGYSVSFNSGYDNKMITISW